MSQLTRILSIDGGVFANNPALCAYTEARTRLSGRPTAREMAILSDLLFAAPDLDNASKENLIALKQEGTRIAEEFDSRLDDFIPYLLP